MRYVVNTLVNILSYRYIGVDPNIPSQFDIFSHIGVGSSSLTTTVTVSITKSVSSFSFSSALTSYKFVNFLTCFSIYGTV
jgi:hypothetical protein